MPAMKKLRYTDLASNQKRLLALTGLKPTEFEALCLFFDQAWQGVFRYKTLEGKPRRRQSTPRKNSTLPTPQDKLLFVLYFLKTNPLQEQLGTHFAMPQSQVSFWLSRLLPTLEQALTRAECLPERKSEQLARAVADQKRLLLDGTERPVLRSSDHETQKEHFSGKKNAIP